MDRMRTLAALLLVGCSSAPLVAVEDASTDASISDAPIDVGHDASALDAFVEHDAARLGDAGRDAGTDAYIAPRDAFVAPDAWAACDVFTNAGCASGQTCRLSDDGHTTPHIGPAHCEPIGPVEEWDNGSRLGENPITASCWTASAQDRCGLGLFCQADGYCARYCDATHNTCGTVHGSVFHCDVSDTPARCVP